MICMRRDVYYLHYNIECFLKHLNKKKENSNITKIYNKIIDV